MPNLHRGKDKDILNAVVNRIAMVQERDAKYAAGRLREPGHLDTLLIDPYDVALATRLANVNAKCRALLAEQRT